MNRILVIESYRERLFKSTVVSNFAPDGVLLTKIRVCATFSFIIIILLGLFGGAGQSAFGQSQTFTTSGSFTVPAGVTSITIQCWGAGGGGSTITSNGARGGGGGGGAYASSVYTVTPGNTYNLTVGTGGAANSSGGNTFFNTSWVIAEGGHGGTSNSTIAGAGGTVASSLGTTRYAGGAGAAGGGTNSGGGGGGAGSTGPGGSATGATAGTGTSLNGGNGGTGVSGGSNGNVGNTYGGGGSGAVTNSGTDRTGGSGANGLVVISWTCPTYSITGTSATNACTTPGTSTITLTSSAAGLPVGTYLVTYNTSLPAVSGLTANMTVSTAGTGTFTATGLITTGSSTITVSTIASGAAPTNCPATISSNNTATIVVSAVPSQPSSIAGAASVCQGTSQTYSVTNVAGVTYTWVLPGGWTKTSGGTTNSIVVTVGASSGTITVTPSNSCGSGTARTLAVTYYTVPLQPSTITGNTTPCAGTAQTYSVTNVGGLTYTWVFPAGWVQNSGGTTNSIVVTVGTTSGSVQVTPSNPGCSGPSRSLAVTITPLPQGSISANGPFCGTGTGQLTWTATAGTGPYTIVYNDGPGNRTINNVTSGTPFNVFTTPVIATTTYTLVSVTGSNGCSRAAAFTGSTATITVRPLPQGSLSGNTICTGGTGQFTFTSTAGTGPFTLMISGQSYTGVISGTPFNAIPNPTVTAVYTVSSIIDANSCIRTSGITGANGTITINPLPQGSLTGNTVCTGGIGQFTFTSSSGTGPFTLIIDGQSYTGVVSGTPFNATPNPAATTSYTLTSITDASSCVRTSSITGSTAAITITPGPTAALTYSGSPYCISVNTPQPGTLTGTGAYTGGFYTSSPTGLTINSTTGEVTPSTSTPGTYVVTYTIPASGGCASVPVLSTVTISSVTTATIATTPLNYCGTLSGGPLGGNTPVNGTGLWTQVSGPGTSTFSAPTSGLTTVTATLYGTYVYRWTISNGPCTPSTADITVTFDAAPTNATIATSPLNFCRNLISGSLGGNTPVTGTGLWTKVSGPGTVSFSAPNSGTSTAAVSAYGAYVYQWTIGNGTCTPSTAQVTVNYYATPTTSSIAISPINNCGTLVSGSLGGITPVAGMGLWSQVSGPGTTTFSNSTSGSSTATVTIYGTYVYQWTISNGTCAPSSSQVTVYFYATPTTATIGTSPLNYCGTLVSGTLGGNTPATGTGLWSQISGPGTTTFSAPASGSSTATATAYGTYIYQWAISHGSCTPSTAQVTVNYFATPTTATVTTSLLNYCGVLLTGSLGGNTPVNGGGLWTQVSGPGTTTFSDAASGLSTATATLYGTYIYQWTISNGTCPPSQAQVTVNYYANPSTATVASSPLEYCGTMITGSLGGNTPADGTGIWTQVSGPGTTVFSAPTTGSSTATASSYGTYIYQWTISNGTCTPSQAQVTVNYYATPTAATISASPLNNCGSLVSGSLGGNTPVDGSGLWTQVSGPGSTTFSAATSGTSTATASIYGTYVYQWTISNGTCSPGTAQVTVNYYPTPTTATIAASPLNFCGTLISTSLNGNTPASGTGLWSQVSGTGSTTFSDATSGLSTATATVYGTYVYQWTISSGTCAPTSAQVTVNYYATPTTATITGTPLEYCGVLVSGSLGGNTPADGSGLWTQISGAGTTTFSDPNSGTSTATASVFGSYIYQWTISNGTCTPSTAQVTVNYTLTPTTAISYAGAPFCQSLVGAQPVNLTGTGAYTGGSYSASPAGLTIDANTGSVTPGTSTAGTYTITYTIAASGGCSSVPFTTTVTITPVPVATISYSGTPFCKSVANVTVSQTGTSGGTYTALPAGLSLDALTGAISPATSDAGTYTVTYTIPASGGCDAVPVTTSVTITASPTASISYSGNPFCQSGGAIQPVTLNGTGAYTGGIFTVLPAGLSINSATGDITPNTSAEGTYTVTYTIPAAGGCGTLPVTTEVTITALPTASISYTGTPFCKSAGTVTVSQTGTSGGIYTSSAPGLSLDAVTGAILPGASDAGTYTVTYTIAAANGCNAVTPTASVTITDIPTATISYSGSPYCIFLSTAQPVTLNGTGAYSGGNYSVLPA